MFAPYKYMLHIIWRFFLFFFFWSRSEPELRFFTALLALFGFLFSFLLTLLGLKYQSSGAALFHEHGAIMLLLTIDVCTCTIALATAMLQTSNPRYLPFFKSVSYFWSLCIWLATFDPCPSLWVVCLYRMFIYPHIFSLWLIRTNSQLQSRISWINFKLHFSCHPHFM